MNNSLAQRPSRSTSYYTFFSSGCMLNRDGSIKSEDTKGKLTLAAVEASVLNAKGIIDLAAGNEATYNRDASRQSAVTILNNKGDVGKTLERGINGVRLD